MARPRALLTNDDGVNSPGIATLASAAVRAGFDAVVAAPSWDSSGASASLTAVEEHGRVLWQRHVLDDLDIPAYGVEAAPAFIVRAAVSGAFGPPPDIVLSGVNHGLNTGHVVLHSGTVGAALTAATYGLPALAVSLAAGTSWRWDTARAALDEILPWLREQTGPIVLNVNVPSVGPTELRGIAAARLASSVPSKPTSPRGAKAGSASPSPKPPVITRLAPTPPSSTSAMSPSRHCGPSVRPTLTSPISRSRQSAGPRPDPDRRPQRGRSAEDQAGVQCSGR